MGRRGGKGGSWGWEGGKKKTAPWAHWSPLPSLTEAIYVNVWKRRNIAFFSFVSYYFPHLHCYRHSPLDCASGRFVFSSLRYSDKLLSFFPFLFLFVSFFLFFCVRRKRSHFTPSPPPLPTPTRHHPRPSYPRTPPQEECPFLLPFLLNSLLPLRTGDNLCCVVVVVVFFFFPLFFPIRFPPTHFSHSHFDCERKQAVQKPPRLSPSLPQASVLPTSLLVQSKSRRGEGEGLWRQDRGGECEMNEYNIVKAVSAFASGKGTQPSVVEVCVCVCGCGAGLGEAWCGAKALFFYTFFLRRVCLCLRLPFQVRNEVTACKTLDHVL